MVLQYNNSLHWSALFLYHIRTSAFRSGIYCPLGAILLFLSLKLEKCVAITVGWVIVVHSRTFSVLSLWSSGSWLFLPTFPTFPFTWCMQGIWIKQVGFWNELVDQKRETLPVLLVIKSSLGFSLCLILWRGETLNWYTRYARLNNDPGIAEGFREWPGSASGLKGIGEIWCRRMCAGIECILKDLLASLVAKNSYFN